MRYSTEPWPGDLERERESADADEDIGASVFCRAGEFWVCDEFSRDAGVVNGRIPDREEDSVCLSLLFECISIANGRGMVGSGLDGDR